MVHRLVRGTEVVLGRAAWGYSRADGTEVWHQRGIALGLVRRDKPTILLRLPLTFRVYADEVVW
jgi:hypothetical protein